MVAPSPTVAVHPSPGPVAAPDVVAPDVVAPDVVAPDVVEAVWSIVHR